MAKVMNGDRLHIAIFGRRNAGKSSIINALTGQPVSIVSDTPGTTTDPVSKAMELLPVGPVMLIDTAGIDDTENELGLERVRRSLRVLESSDMALLVIDGSGNAGELEDEVLKKCEEQKVPCIIILNKADLPQSEETAKWLSGKPFVKVSAKNSEGIEILKEKIIENAPSSWEPPFLKDLLSPGQVILLVTPIDASAPKGRMIMPQVRAWRDILDADAIALSCQTEELAATLAKLKDPPDLVVTDSQVFPKVAAVVPESVPLTSFSILSARQKGNLAEMVRAVKAVDSLKPGDKVLIAESCTHHSLHDDIARVKIPKLLSKKIGGDLIVDIAAGAGYPENLKDYKLVIHCGACTLNRREMLRRQAVPAKLGLPMTNFGVLISYISGVFPRALKPIPEFEEERWLRKQW